MKYKQELLSGSIALLLSTAHGTTVALADDSGGVLDSTMGETILMEFVVAASTNGDPDPDPDNDFICDFPEEKSVIEMSLADNGKEYVAEVSVPISIKDLDSLQISSNSWFFNVDDGTDKTLVYSARMENVQIGEAIPEHAAIMYHNIFESYQSYPLAGQIRTIKMPSPLTASDMYLRFDLYKAPPEGELLDPTKEYKTLMTVTCFSEIKPTYPPYAVVPDEDV